jgi:tRNA threonylcarbamoyl adenosine modification protein (Sua5/YciO/YrdC/YwlC family)
VSAIDEAIAAVRGGELVVIPTDTVHGIGTRADDPAATVRIFEAKGRPRHLELPVFVGTFAEARALAAFDDLASILVDRFWPGRLTLVLPRSEPSRDWDLGGDGSTIGLRMPAHPLALAIVRGAGPMAVTSANRSGQPTPASGEAVADIFGDAVSVYLLEERPLAGEPSTVVDLSTGEPRVLRAGAIAAEEVLRALPPDDRSR